MDVEERKIYIDKLIKLIDTKYKNKLIHIAKTPLLLTDLQNTKNINNFWFSGQKIYQNPFGLWVSCGSDWLKFQLEASKKYLTKWLTSENIYIVSIDKQKILYIKTVKKLIEFHKKYAIYNVNKGYNIVWKNVKKDYNGIIICPYLGDKIWKKMPLFDYKTHLYHVLPRSNIKKEKIPIKSFYIKSEANSYIKKILGKDIIDYPEFYLEWYRHWDSASGVIWKMESIKNIDLIDLDLDIKK